MKIASDFDIQVAKWSNYIKVATYRYQVDGNQGELYNDALVLLWEMLESNEFHPESAGFRKMFKTRLFQNVCIDSNRKERRHLDRQTRLEYSSSEGSGESLNAEVAEVLCENYVSAEEYEINPVIDVLKSKLSDIEVAVLTELLDPSPAVMAIHDANWSKGKNTKPTLGTIAQALEVTEKKVRRAVNKISWAYVQVTGNTSVIPFIKGV